MIEKSFPQDRRLIIFRIRNTSAGTYFKEKVRSVMFVWSIKFRFRRRLFQISRLTGYKKGYLIDRALRAYLTEYIDEYEMPGWGGNEGLAAITKYVREKKGWSRDNFRNEAYKWWLDGFCHFDRDLRKGFKEELVLEKNYKVYNGVFTWFDEKRAIWPHYPYTFQLVTVKGMLCRIPVGAFYEVY